MTHGELNQTIREVMAKADVDGRTVLRILRGEGGSYTSHARRRLAWTLGCGPSELRERLQAMLTQRPVHAGPAQTLSVCDAPRLQA